MKPTLEDTLVRNGVPLAELEKAKSYQKKYGGQLELLLVNMGVISSEVLPKIYAELLCVPLITALPADDWEPPALPSGLSLEDLLASNWIPVAVTAEAIEFWTNRPLNREAHEILAAYAGAVNYAVIPDDFVTQLKTRVLNVAMASGAELSSTEEARLRELALEAPTVNLLNSLITRALRMRASDMHVEPYLDKGKVRFRIDGVLQDIETISGHLILPVITRLKILSNMDIAERRRPQDGKIEMKIGGIELDIRVSALPLNNGESVVMRFLKKDAIQYDMDALGISPDIEQLLQEDLQTTAGVVLLTGPTGSGKTTSLYTFLNRLNTPGVKIITLEDPVEYQIEGINQVQVQSDIGFDFAAGLRSIVRQDPDIIMLGEIRDKETASIAMQSALTGHLVFSTVHTNDAPSAFTRLLDLGVEEFLLNAALVSIVAQRLARRLCPHCSQPHPASQHLISKYQLTDIAAAYGVDAIDLRQPVGCEHCSFTGYRGRVAVIEYLRCDEAIQSIPKDQYFIQNAQKVNRGRGIRNLLEDGLLKAIKGVTTVDEVMRIAG